MVYIKISQLGTPCIGSKRFKENVLQVENKTKQNKSLFYLTWLAFVTGV